MIPIKVTNSEGSAPLAKLAKGLNYALDNGANVSCIAFASSRPSPVLEKAIERAAQLGHLVVTAAGNGGRDITQRKRFPCSYTERLDTLCVAGGDERGLLAHRSNFASYVDIAAPGTRIWSTGIHNKYFRYGGTSAATAHVAGVASLLYGMGHPLRIVISALVKAVDVLSDSSGGFFSHFGVVDASRAEKLAENTATFPSTAPPKPTTPSTTRPKSTTELVPSTEPTTTSTVSPKLTLPPWLSWLIPSTKPTTQLVPSSTRTYEETPHLNLDVHWPPAESSVRGKRCLGPDSEFLLLKVVTKAQ
ncbi:hypothetical protein FOZ60_014854 [Perkinsus olseni]|uniref:subtilisin n=1 Tax=Perkinsus olseni TaxID=32597 RepID=A0A7J6N6N8_PEROL|nr:hypothetical protein FOZ60_014854 [Perkinsus olseni]